MNDWKMIWNGFCDEVAVSVHKKDLEKVFEEDIAREFFRALDWFRLNKGLAEQYPIKFATVTHRADFALFVTDKEVPEIIVELKRPKKKKEEKDAKQLIDYMKQKHCSFGILLLGDKLEVYYIDYSKPEHIALPVETIKYQHDNEAAHQFMEVLYRKTYNPAHMLEYCHKRVKVNKSVEYWCSEAGKTEIVNMIVERSDLPENLLETLRSTLQIDVRRKDGLSAVSATQQPTKNVEQTPKANVKSQANRVWMIPADRRYFNHDACFNERGCIYWKQYYKFQVGDTVYIYFSHPLKQVAYKCEVVACNLPYSPEMDGEIKYYKRAEDFEKAKEHNRFYKLVRTGETSSSELTYHHLLKNGLHGGIRGALNLSDKSFEELLKYVEEKF